MSKQNRVLPALLLLIAPPVLAQDPAPPDPASSAPPASAAPSAEPVLPPPPPPSPEPPQEEPGGLFDRLGVGKQSAYWQPAGLLQFWMFASHEGDATASEFRVRRAEIRVRGQMLPDLVSYSIMVDPARAAIDADGDIPDSILQDFWITLQTSVADISVGQFKIPISLEALTGNPRLLFPERPLLTRTFSDTRDVGLRIEKKLGDHFYYYAGVFNGAGQNLRENDKEKDVALRLEGYPMEGLTVAAAGYARLGDRDRGVKDRVEGSARYDAGGLLLQAEYVRAWDGSAAERVEGHGAYGLAGYTLGNVIPALRAGFVDRNVDVDGDSVMHYEGCLNYLLSGNEVKFALSVGHFAPEEGDGETQVTFLSQLWF